jgi:hypothetical protein
MRRIANEAVAGTKSENLPAQFIFLPLRGSRAALVGRGVGWAATRLGQHLSIRRPHCGVSAIR